MSTSPKRLAALASAALAVAGITVLAPTAAQANPAGTGPRHQRGLRRRRQHRRRRTTPTSSSSTTRPASPVDLLGDVRRRTAPRRGASGDRVDGPARLASRAGATTWSEMSAAGAGGRGDLPTPDRVAAPSISMAAGRWPGAADRQRVRARHQRSATSPAPPASSTWSASTPAPGHQQLRGRGRPCGHRDPERQPQRAGHRHRQQLRRLHARRPPRPRRARCVPAGAASFSRHDRRDPGHRHRHLAAPRTTPSRPPAW